MKKFKERFDAFSDAVIAILLTIMVLELPIEVVNGTIDYEGLFQAIGIYFISFCMVANVWYRHALAFNQIKEVPNHIIVLDFVLIMFLSLIPAFTRLMVVDVTNITVMLYGGDYMLVLILQDFITQQIVHTRYSDKAAIRLAYNKILGRIPYVGLVMQAAFLVVGYWYPTVALVFYIVIPVESFLMNARRQQDFQDVEDLDSKQLTSYMDMPADKQREFKRKMREYRRELQNSGMSRSEQRDVWRRQMGEIQQKMAARGLDSHGRPLRGDAGSSVGVDNASGANNANGASDAGTSATATKTDGAAGPDAFDRTERERIIGRIRDGRRDRRDRRDRSDRRDRRQ